MVKTTQAVTRFKSDVMIDSFSDGHDGGSEVFAGIDTMLYNSVSATSTDSEGDIWAGLYIAERNGKTEIIARLQQSIDGDGNNWKTIYEKHTAISGGIQEKTWYKLEISYDQAADSVTFYIYDNAGITLSTSVAENLPAYAGSAFSQEGPSLTTGMSNFDQSPELCHVFAQFDNVFLNGSLLDDFSGTALDPLKWSSTEIAKKIENDSALIMADSMGATETVYLNTDIPLANTAVDVQIDSKSIISSGSKGLFRLSGYFYNDELGFRFGRNI